MDISCAAMLTRKGFSAMLNIASFRSMYLYVTQWIKRTTKTYRNETKKKNIKNYCDVNFAGALTMHNLVSFIFFLSSHFTNFYLCFCFVVDVVIKFNCNLFKICRRSNHFGSIHQGNVYANNGQNDGTKITEKKIKKR